MNSTSGTRLVARGVLAASWIVALALFAKGHDGAGDGFSAGLTAAAGTLLHVFATGPQELRALRVVRHAQRIAGAGLALVLVPALGPLLFGAPPFTHWPPPGEEAPALGVLHLSSALVLELGVFAVVLGLVLRAMTLFGRFEPEEAP